MAYPFPCESICYFCEHTSYLNENNKCKKLHLLHFEICHQIASLQNLYSVILTYIFKGQAFEAAILTRKLWKMQTLLSTSDWKSGIGHRLAILRMLYIITLTYIFQVTNFESVNILKTVRASKKLLTNDFYRGWYLPSNAIIANVVLRDLDLNFHGKTFQGGILTCKRWKTANITIAIG